MKKNTQTSNWLENYNDSEVNLPQGFVGEGTFNGPKFDNPAWGGQFQEGGKLTFLQPTSDKLPQGYRIPYSDPSSERAMSIGGENGEPAYLIPSFKYGQPLYDPIGEFKKTKEHLGGPFKTWQEADKWENETRHPAVEKGKNIMFPQEQFQMGGSVYPVNYVPEAQEGMKVPSRKDYKTQGQYNAALKTHKLNLHKHELANNPEKIKGESDKDYENRTKYFNFKVRQEENKNPVSKAYLEMKDNQNADPDAVTRTLRQIATSPAHVGYGIYNAANPNNLDKYKSRVTKNNEDLDLTNSSLDAASLLVPFDYGMKASPLLQQAAKRTVKEVAEDEGFNLLKAGNKWINSFQTGGSIPGAVGFSYARTQGSAPSNGKYAKKTMASAQNGKEMQYYQNGLDWKPKSISRDGSVIKDDMGYWNPKNWGSPVEIGSNNITMEGVYEPLLGVSDIGDIKLMKPGKNYKFKGKKVTEYPMAKNGINKQDQKTFEQLDQLTNFTNYNKPTVGGWLNKYN